MCDNKKADNEPCKIPDYRIYKVEDVPILVKVEKLLAAQGLKDPWLRNEVWRFSDKIWGKRSAVLIFSRGFKVGLVAFIATIAGTALYEKYNGSKAEHD